MQVNGLKPVGDWKGGKVGNYKSEHIMNILHPRVSATLKWHGETEIKTAAIDLLWNMWQVENNQQIFINSILPRFCHFRDSLQLGLSRLNCLAPHLFGGQFLLVVLPYPPS